MQNVNDVLHGVFFIDRFDYSRCFKLAGGETCKQAGTSFVAILAIKTAVVAVAGAW